MNAKFFLTTSAVLALIAFESIYSTMYGQNKNYLCNNGYKANVQASSLVSYEDFLGALSTSHGYAFKNGIYLGGGTGIGFRPWDIQGEKNRVIIPIFMEAKYSFLKKTFLIPFIDLIAGGAAAFPTQRAGYFIHPSLGVTAWKISIAVGFGIHSMNRSTYGNEEINTMPERSGNKNTAFSISLAYNFR